MSLFRKLASELSGKNNKKSTYNTSYNEKNYSYNQPKEILWQCRCCGMRTVTWSNNRRGPKAGICRARGKVNGMTRPHEWRKIM